MLNMNVQKRTVGFDTGDEFIQKPSIQTEEKTHKCWRRFMNQRAINRAYIPTTHGKLSFFYNDNNL